MWTSTAFTSSVALVSPLLSGHGEAAFIAELPKADAAEFRMPLVGEVVVIVSNKDSLSEDRFASEIHRLNLTYSVALAGSAPFTDGALVDGSSLYVTVPYRLSRLLGRG